MRDYGSVSPQFWIGATGKRLRGNPEAQLVALYLMTCPHANMIGVFHCPLLYIAHETGLPFEGASKGLRSLQEEGFCLYDADSEMIFVVRMAEYQVGSELKEGDNKIVGVKKAYLNIAETRMQRAFHEVYSSAFRLPEWVEKPHEKPLEKQAASKPLRSPFEAPSKQLTGSVSVSVSGTGTRSVACATTIPDDFSITDHLRQWAKAQGITGLEAHFQTFVENCKKSRYTYKNWEGAAQTAIMKEHGKANSRAPPNAATSEKTGISPKKPKKPIGVDEHGRIVDN